MDGWGLGKVPLSDAIQQAKVPFVSSLYNQYPHATLITCGEEVGLPEGQMGNSEVGHMTIGLGRVLLQDLPKIDQQFKFVRFLKIYETRKLLLKQDEIGKSYSLKNPAELIKIIKLAKEYAKNIDAEFYFVYMPVEKFFNKNYDPSNYEGIKKIIKSLNINFIDINNVFDREDNPLDLFPFKMFSHYNPEGYRKVAKEIFDLTIDK